MSPDFFNEQNVQKLCEAAKLSAAQLSEGENPFRDELAKRNYSLSTRMDSFSHHQEVMALMALLADKYFPVGAVMDSTEMDGTRGILISMYTLAQSFAAVADVSNASEPESNPVQGLIASLKACDEAHPPMTFMGLDPDQCVASVGGMKQWMFIRDAVFALCLKSESEVTV